MCVHPLLKGEVWDFTMKFSFKVCSESNSGEEIRDRFFPRTLWSVFNRSLLNVWIIGSHEFPLFLFIEILMSWRLMELIIKYLCIHIWKKERLSGKPGRSTSVIWHDLIVALGESELQKDDTKSFSKGGYSFLEKKKQTVRMISEKHISVNWQNGIFGPRKTESF